MNIMFKTNICMLQLMFIVQQQSNEFFVVPPNSANFLDHVCCYRWYTK